MFNPIHDLKILVDVSSPTAAYQRNLSSARAWASFRALLVPLAHQRFMGKILYNNSSFLLYVQRKRCKIIASRRAQIQHQHQNTKHREMRITPPPPQERREQPRPPSIVLVELLLLYTRHIDTRTNIERVGGLRVERADGRVQTAAVRGAHGRLVQRAPERVEGDVDRAAVSTCLLQLLTPPNQKHYTQDEQRSQGGGRYTKMVVKKKTHKVQEAKRRQGNINEGSYCTRENKLI